MASNNSFSSSGKNRKNHDTSSQSRVTSFFKPSPETSVSRKSDERQLNGHPSRFRAIGVKKRFQESPNRGVSHTQQVTPTKNSSETINSNSVSSGMMRKRVIQDSPIQKTSVQRDEVIAIDLDSSDGASSLDADVFPSPQKKKRVARVVKKPLESQISNIPRTSKVFDPPQKKGGLVMRSPNKSFVRDNIPTRMALEEKKNLNREKPTGVRDIEIDAITFPPIQKLKRTHSLSISQEDSTKDNEEQPCMKRCTVVLEKLGINTNSQKQAKNENKSKRQVVVAEKLDFAGKIDAIKRSRTVTTLKSAEASTSNEIDGASFLSADIKQPAPPGFVKKINEVSKKRAFESCPKPAIPILQKKPRKEESTTTLVDVNRIQLDTISTTANCQATQDEGSEIVQKASQRRILRRSILHSAEKNGLSVTSKITVGLEEINAGAVVAFKQTYQDIETLLDLKLGVMICPDFKKALQIPKQILPNSFHVNFNFFMKRKPVEHIEALRSQHIDCHKYPHAVDLHAVIYGILMEGKEHVVLHRAQELIYTTLGLHPSGDALMRKYYWSILSRHFDDVDPCSRWENIRSLLEEVLNADSEDAARMYVDPNTSPSKLECCRATLGVIIHVLREDLRCWISLATQPSAQLRERNELPLVARLLWPQTTIPHINMACRELIRYHIAALKSSNTLNVSYTEPLVKMMAVVTQLSDLHLPLKIRKPGWHMMNLAREIVLHSDDVVDNSSCPFYSSFGSLELELLLPLTILSRLKPQISIPEAEHLNLTWMLNSFLEIQTQQSREDVVTLFRSKPPTEINAFLTALGTYFKLFGSFKTWFHMRTKYRSSASRSSPIPGQSSTQPLSLDMYSHTFTPSHLMDDLRQAKYLLEANKESDKGCFYSCLSW